MANQPQDKKAVKYAGLGFQLVAIVLAFVFTGKYLDQYFKYEAVFLLVGVFIAVFAVIYILIKKLG